MTTTLFFGTILNLNSISAALVTPTTIGQGQLVADLATGQVIAKKNDQQRLPIASISKLLVVYMVEEAIQEGRLKEDTLVTVIPNIVTFSHNNGVANVPLSTQQRYTIHDLLNMALLPSSNSAAMTLASVVSGNQKKYYQQAEQLLASLGIKKAEIVSASGLRDGDLDAFNDPKVSDNTENMLSAREVAIIASRLITKYPSVLKITNQLVASVPGSNGTTMLIKNTDTILGGPKYHFEGLKTGTTPYDGGNFVGVATVQGRKVLTVLLNTGLGSATQSKFTGTEQMLDQVNQQVHVIHPTKQQLTTKTIKTANPIVVLWRKIMALF
jgi:D-alanyl-D-alanine carboxypeptidase (penicillin-binding protein 5/6)